MIGFLESTHSQNDNDLTSSKLLSYLLIKPSWRLIITAQVGLLVRIASPRSCRDFTVINKLHCSKLYIPSVINYINSTRTEQASKNEVIIMITQLLFKNLKSLFSCYFFCLNLT